MKTTLSVIKADIGSIGGHVAPSQQLLETVRDGIATELGGLISDFHVGNTGDDIAILMVHDRGVGNEEIHHLAWNTFLEGTETAKRQGLYGGRPGSARRCLQRQRQGHGAGRRRDGVRGPAQRAIPVLRRRQD